MSIRLLEWLWTKAESQTYTRMIRFAEMYYGNEPEVTSHDPDIRAAQQRQKALWQSGQQFIDAMYAEFYEDPEEAKLRMGEPWTTRLKSKLSSTLSRWTKPPTQSGGTRSSLGSRNSNRGA